MKKAFTLIEIMVGIAILVLLAALAFRTFTAYRTTSEMDNAVRQILSTLRLAQSKTLAAEANAQYGVHFELDRIILFGGDDFTSGPVIETDVLSAHVVSSAGLLGGGPDVIFDRLTGKTEQGGIITLTSTIDGSMRHVVIDASGQVRTEASPLPALGTRVVDTRHVNFQLGWSIQSATTTTLVFLDPNTVVNIDMAAYFDSGKSVFDWSGTIDVGGSSQVLRIHTITLSPFDTILSIDRDRQTNSKAVSISIDGKLIASYDPAGNLIVGPFGGTATAQ